MAQVWAHWHTVLITTAALVPLTLLVVAGMVRRRSRAGVSRGRAWRWSLAEGAMVLGTLPWVWMTLTPVQVPPGTVLVYLEPLSDLRAQLTQPLPWVITQVGGNLLVFFALGAGAPVRFAAFAAPARLLLLLGAACSLMIEVTQLLFVTNRVCSVDDVLVNAVGCLLGGLATRPWWSRARVPVPA
ncbi:VanZ family protein [Catellatospora sichuanensis]|uniref:VanZ family protein n=1 Tax=Catellatospora sichuanensis TaxID=1969805 RepID=UPI00118419C8|nr:VanZ family protein [Catellatospora sichuanensis]